jgi:acetate kinase
METRCGDLDPAVVPYLAQQLHLSGAQIISALNRKAGLAGLSGSDANPEQLLTSPSTQAQFAVELYCYRIRKYIGAYLAVLGGCDGIVFGGGVGEHVPQIRARALEGLQWAGVRLDAARNEAARGGNARIDEEHASVRVHVIATDEESALARAALGLLKN